MAAYDTTRYREPAPVATVTLRNIATGESIPGIELLIDTGADLTLLPLRPLERIGVLPEHGKGYTVRAFDGREMEVGAVTVEMDFCDETFCGQYAVTTEPRGFLGRDVLNELTLHLYGQRLAWSVEL